MDNYTVERDQNQNLVVVKNGLKVCQVTVMSDPPPNARAEALQADDWVYDFCRPVSHAELAHVMAAAEAAVA